MSGASNEGAERGRGRGSDFAPSGAASGLPGMGNLASSQGAPGGFPTTHTFFDPLAGPGGHPGTFPPPGHQIGMQGVQSVLSYPAPPPGGVGRLSGMIDTAGAGPGLMGLPPAPNPYMNFPHQSPAPGGLPLGPAPPQQ
eukprot:TRINITY_DN608_c0_g1_i2.p3 TRINITY_DN608_c0_g1~~TRINITY_DN608_c0_g1_i2.p3  ORF type:complete len:139 (-),score=5.90 TRINITY_DN608_c0_g1_i2:390-806(-)